MRHPYKNSKVAVNPPSPAFLIGLFLRNTPAVAFRWGLLVSSGPGFDNLVAVFASRPEEERGGHVIAAILQVLCDFGSMYTTVWAEEGRGGASAGGFWTRYMRFGGLLRNLPDTPVVL